MGLEFRAFKELRLVQAGCSDCSVSHRCSGNRCTRAYFAWRTGFSGFILKRRVRSRIATTVQGLRALSGFKLQGGYPESPIPLN